MSEANRDESERAKALAEESLPHNPEKAVKLLEKAQRMWPEIGGIAPIMVVAEILSISRQPGKDFYAIMKVSIAACFASHKIITAVFLPKKGTPCGRRVQDQEAVSHAGPPAPSRQE